MHGIRTQSMIRQQRTLVSRAHITSVKRRALPLRGGRKCDWLPQWRFAAEAATGYDPRRCPQSPSDNSPAQPAWRILLVDDEPTQRLIMARLLKRGGYEVEMAANGREALAKLEQGDFPLMITDWEMPEMDGVALCRALRSKEQGYTYIILLTSRDAIEHLVAGLQSGADDYLIKPVIEPELIARLNTGRRIVTLERFATRRE